MQTCIVKVRKDGSLALPKAVRKELKLRTGEELEIVMRRPERQDYLLQVREKLNDLVTPEEGQRWLSTPNTMFEGRCPIDLLKQGEGERVIQLLIRLEEGIHN